MQNDLDLLVDDRLGRYGEQETGALPGGMEISNSKGGQEPTPGLDAENTMEIPQTTSPRL